MEIHRGETLAVVGESGSGKTTVGRALVRLLDTTAGRIVFDGEDCAAFTRERLAAFRRRTQMVFQDPYSSLDPRMRLGDIVAEGLRMERLSGAERRRRAAEMLAEVSLPGDFIRRFPHELSGGQRQRVCIARAIVGEPAFIVADEPVSALDVTVQHQVMTLLSRLQAKYGFTVLFISHDLGIVEQIANRVMVMYRGRLIELGSRDDIYDRPCHPYTHRLLAATPRMARRAEGGYALITPDLRPVEPPPGCHWFDSSANTDAQVRMVEIERGHWVCCTS
jgi:peptide/nickel transport system ATP-binding protein